MRWKPDPNEGLGVWKSYFAFLPCTLDDGHRVFWEWYEGTELIDVSSGRRRSKDATRAADSDWMPWWSVEGGRPPAKPIKRVERCDI